MSDFLLNTFSMSKSCQYKGDSFRVRDNGAILRESRPSGRHRKHDGKWTFGIKNEESGYAVFCGDPVHRIVATAFHGEPPAKQLVVDHIDTNRMNNRPENLRWVTKLENILLNPVTCKRIIEAYGSVEAFFADPAKPISKRLNFSYEWMRTVTKDEAARSKEKLERWASSSKSSSGGGLGEWLFTHRSQVEQPKLPEITRSLTRGALQVDWRTPTDFPLCPDPKIGAALFDYAEKLEFGSTFSESHYGRSIVVDGGLDRHSDCIVVVCYIENAMVSRWGITAIYKHNGKFLHENKGTYISVIDAMELYSSSQGDTFDPSRSTLDLGLSFPIK